MPDRRGFSSLCALALVALLACQPADDGSDADADSAAAAAADPAGDDAVTVTAKDFEFEAPASIPSGWNDFRFVNEGEQEHFFLLYRLPEGRTFSDYRSDVTETFVEVWGRYDSGDLTREETLAALGEELPPWFFETEAAGGAALTEPGRTAHVTLDLEPGTYVMECYVKTPQGTWHNERGMLKELTVTGDSTGAEAPEADAELTLSNYEIAVSDTLTAGRQTIAVHVTDTPEGLMPHDVNLFRIESDTTTVEEIVAWMDWMDLEQFRSPAPAVSLGGVESMAAGATGYMTVDLEPGRYVLMSEEYASRGMVREFTVE